MSYFLRTPANDNVAFIFYRDWIFKRITNPDWTTVWYSAADLEGERAERYEKYLELTGTDSADGIQWRPHDWMNDMCSWSPLREWPNEFHASRKAKSDRAAPKGDSQKLFLLTLAEKGDERALLHPEVATRRDYWGRTPLHELASSGCLAVIRHHLVSVVKDKHGDTPLHCLALCGRKEVLSHPDVAAIRGRSGRTPMHELTTHCTLNRKDAEAVRGILANPLSGVVKDDDGWTPLHYLAYVKLGDCEAHPLFNVVKNGEGLTPAMMYGKGFNEERWNYIEQMNSSTS